MHRNLIYLLYRVVQAVAFPFLVVYLLLRGVRERRYFPRIGERFGILPYAFQGTASGAIWLHAVSVGEVLSSVRLLKRLRSEYPARRLFVSSTTLAGRALAEEKLQDLVDGVFYAPVDYCFAVRGVLRALRPSLVIVLETEIWPNLYAEVKRIGAGLVIVNGRISDKAMPSYRRQRWFFRAALSWPDVILAQSREAAERYRELGAPAERVKDAGNLKYDFEAGGLKPPAAVSRLLGRTAPNQVWIAASTMPPALAGDVDEDDVVIEAFQRLARDHRRLLLVLVPRRPNRFDEAGGKLQEAGVAFVRRSGLTGDEDLKLPGVLLLDTIGELGGIFPLGDVVFMGGTLAERGGHNILEPAFFGKPVIVGPHMENFSAIAEEFRAGGALVEIGAPGDLAASVDRLLRDESERRRVGDRARVLAERKRGATERAFAEIRRLSGVEVPKMVRAWFPRLLLTPFAAAWGVGGRLKRRRLTARRRWLKTPVLSIGGIGMGGAGKTPFTLFLARAMRARGLMPAILTRGYRRRVPEKSTILEAGSSARTTLTGDEAQLFLRAGVAHLGIGADRHATGALVESRFHPDVMLLDDGFQHWGLGRDLDIVLIDALDPFGGDALFPLGWLREPLDALGRADLFVITRAEAGSPLEGIEARLRQYNASAPVFRSRVKPLRWIDVATGEKSDVGGLAGQALGAFCGLANPASFWRSLATLGHRPVACWKFGDHHHYGPQELKRMAAHARSAGVGVLVTTEKDVMNLPPDVAGLVEPLRLAWLEIGMEVEREEVLLDFVLSRLREKAASASSG